MALIRRSWLALAAGILWCCFLAGCASAERESDLPWNMSQPWESAPGMPFGTPGGY